MRQNGSNLNGRSGARPTARRDLGQLPSGQRKRHRKPGAMYLNHSRGFSDRSARIGNSRTPRRSSRLPYALIAVGCALVLFIAAVVGYVNRSVDVELNGQMDPYGWGINGRKFGDHEPLEVSADRRVRMSMTNMTMMAHPMHIHGHTWGLPGSGGLRKDTVLVAPMQTIEADLLTDNPGQWMLHCHNIYHAEVGMMTTMRYV